MKLHINIWTNNIQDTVTTRLVLNFSTSSKHSNLILDIHALRIFSNVEILVLIGMLEVSSNVIYVNIHLLLFSGLPILWPKCAIVSMCKVIQAPHKYIHMSNTCTYTLKTYTINTLARSISVPPYSNQF